MSKIYSFVLFVIIISACKKAKNTVAGCLENALTTRQIENQPATIQKSGTDFYIVEHSTYDTRLKPCILPETFRIDGLQVIISGDVKQTVQTGPCCTDDFVITEIN